MKNGLITLFLLPLVFNGFSQDIGYEIRGMYTRTIVEETLDGVATISDINPGYPSSWVSSYISVEILVTCNGETLRAESANDTLSNEQISILAMADIGSDIVVDVRYIPDNSLKHNDIKVINFSLTVVPAVEAEYPGGYELLKQYLKENAIDKIPESVVMVSQFATVRFSINEEGKIVNAQISRTTGNEKIDELLLQTINNMQDWKPAESSDGIKVAQEFELFVGNMDGC